MSAIFKITGGKKLSGTVKISGSKNAALPILAATIAIREKVRIENLPRISDVENFLKILKTCGAEIQIEKNSAEISTEKFDPKNLQKCADEIEKMRGSILLLGPVLARFGKIKIPFPGGCVLGARPAEAHLRGFEKLGAEILESEKFLELKLPRDFRPKNSRIILTEMSVTATENLAIFAAATNSKTEIRLAAIEPHVSNLLNFLQNCGAQIRGIGTHFLEIRGGNFRSGKIEICADYLEAGTFILIGILTKSKIKIENFNAADLDSFFEKLEKCGAKFKIGENWCETFPTENFRATNLKTSFWPNFPTDLMAPFAVLLNFAAGESRVFERLFENRFGFLFELEKMGARFEILNPHEAKIFGVKKLRGAKIASQDLRAGGACVAAALAADGESEVSNVNYIFRGYEKFVEKLQKLGAEIAVAEV